jgi:hypothetical protein
MSFPRPICDAIKHPDEPKISSGFGIRYPAVMSLEEFRVLYPPGETYRVGHHVEALAEHWGVSAELLAQTVRGSCLTTLVDEVLNWWDEQPAPSYPRRETFVRLKDRTLIIREAPHPTHQVCYIALGAGY